MMAGTYDGFIGELEHLHDRGWAIIPVPPRSKNPGRRGWQHERHTRNDLRTAFPAVANVGVLLGEPSGNLIDIDLDSPVAVELAHRFLPSTAARFGHGRAPESHWLYVVDQPVTTKRFQDPTRNVTDARSMLVELRATGTQTLLPPSVHPSGEPVTWAERGDPAPVSGPELLARVARLAAAALLVIHWPAEGSRHDAALALAGGLLRAGWTRQETGRFLGAIARAAGDGEAEDRVRAVTSTGDALDAGHRATGWPKLRELIDARVVDTARAWLGISQDGNDSEDASESATSETVPDPFPVHVFPPEIERFIVAGATAMGVPVEFIAMPVLGFAAGLIGNLRVLQVKESWKEPAILWTAVVGEPGSGKSPALSYAQKPVDFIQGVAWDRYQEAMRKWSADQAESPKGRPSASLQPKLKSFYTTDATLEAIAGMISMTAGLSVIRDELVGWVKSHDAYRASGDRQAWLQLWSGSSLKIDRKTSPTIFVTHPAISVIGGIQPDRVPDLRDDAATNDGFVDRLLIAWPDASPPPWTDADVDQKVIEAVTVLFMRLRIGADGTEIPRTTVRLDDIARQHWIAWFNENQATIGTTRGLAAGWAAKYPRQVLRIALVLHALHHPNDLSARVSPEVIDGAIAIVECLRTHLGRVLKVIGQGLPAATSSAGVLSRLHGILIRQQGEWISRSDLHQAFGGNLKAEALSAALAKLEEEGIAVQRAVPTEGRPRVEWRLARAERTKKGSGSEAMHTASFVSSFFREDEEGVESPPDPIEEATCCLCGAALDDGRHYLCADCAEDRGGGEPHSDEGKDDAT